MSFRMSVGDKICAGSRPDSEDDARCREFHGRAVIFRRKLWTTVFRRRLHGFNNRLWRCVCPSD